MKDASGASSTTPCSLLLPFLGMFIGLAAAKETLGASSDTVILGRIFLPGDGAGVVVVDGADAERLKSTESKAEIGPEQIFVMNAKK